VKTYADKTKALAADVILQAAVEEAIGLLGPAVALERMVPDVDLVSGLLPRIDNEVLLAAARSAELLLERA
jgi:hypothetical protein